MSQVMRRPISRAVRTASKVASAADWDTAQVMPEQWNVPVRLKMSFQGNMPGAADQKDDPSRS